MRKFFRNVFLLLFSLFSILIVLAAYEYSRLPEVSVLKRKNPRTTALMKLRDEDYRKRGLNPRHQQIWVSYATVSEHLKKAILLSEDSSFFSHKGIDFFELKEALKRDWEEGKFTRGGSTITMQEIFAFQQRGIGPDGKVKGRFVFCGVRPKFIEKFRAAGVKISPDLFDPTKSLEM